MNISTMNMILTSSFLELNGHIDSDLCFFLEHTIPYISNISLTLSRYYSRSTVLDIV